MYGHVEKLAEEIKKGAASVEGVEAKLWQVCVTLFIRHRITNFTHSSVHAVSVQLNPPGRAIILFTSHPTHKEYQLGHPLEAERFTMEFLLCLGPSRL